MRGIYVSTSSEQNLTPFYCTDNLHQETYALTFPQDVPVIAIPKNIDFRNAAGEYTAHWQREGQTVNVVHRLHSYAVRGPYALCQPEDYPAFRELYHSVRHGFRGQILYGDLDQMQVVPAAQ
jgi:hypothetical protein